MTQYWFVSTKYRPNSKLALFTFVLAFVVILLGAYTRITNAGLSCPDWPNCFGYLTAPHTANQLIEATQRFPGTAIEVKKAWTEMVHRYFAGTEGILILFLAGSIIFTRKAKDLRAIFIATALIGLLIFQVMLGMWTVTEKLKPFIVLGHLLTGLSILSLLWWSYLDLNLRDHLHNQRVSSKLVTALWGGLFIIIAQITLGGWVSTHYAGLACVDFPYCNGEVFPTLQFNHLDSHLITIHMLHRIGAIATGLYLAGLCIALLNQPAFKAFATLILALLALQLMLGILNIIWLRPVWLALSHHAIAIVLLLTLIAALVKSSVMDHKHAWFS